MNRWTQGGLSGLAGKLVACAVMWTVAGCGGGGGGGGTTPPPPVVEPSIPDAVTQAAGKAELRAYSTPSANKAELKWTDWIEGETGFRIDKSVNGAWTQVTTLAANATQPWGMGWSGTLDAAATSYRVVALVSGGKEVALKSPAGLTELKLGPAPAGAAIALSMAEPLKNEVKLSIAGAPEAQSAGFYIDQSAAPLPIAVTKPSFETNWDTSSLINGGHKVRSLLQYTPDTFVEIERVVTVGNTEIKAAIVTLVDNQTARATVYVVPTAKVALVSGSLSVDGKEVGTSTKVGCHYPTPASFCEPAYVFALDLAGYTLGTHTLAARIVDVNGNEALASGTLVKGVPLVVTLTSPTSGRFTGAKVQIRGEVTGDPANSVYAAVDFSGRILQERNSYGAISADFDLTGLPDATYFMTVTARAPDGTSNAVTRFVFWQANPPMNYEWIRDIAGSLFSSGRAGPLLENGGARIWERPNGTPVTLAGAGQSYLSFRYVNGVWVGRADVLDTGLFSWGSDGARRTLAASGVGGFSTAGNKVGWVSLTTATPTLVLMDLATLAQVTVPLDIDPAKSRIGSLSMGVGAGGSTVVAYSVETKDIQGNYSSAAVYAYDTASNQHRLLSNPAALARSIVTDGKQVAWYADPNNYSLPNELWLAPVDGSGAPQKLGSALNNEPKWLDGMLVWTEDAGLGSNSIKAYRDGSTFTLLTQFQAQLLAAGSGSVAYTGGKRLLVWSPEKGERLVHRLYEGMGYGSVAIADGWLYFTAGGALYRVPL